ncbi:MAG: hypothetical protein K2J85_02925 [Anaeroplasmataceae bacterium]|nr:hypothetical protein [Anaeroplasmataceae bacterium]
MYVGANGTVTYPAQNRVLTPDEKIAVFAGSDFSLNVIPNENYKANIWINGEKTEPQLEITLTDIQMDYNIQVEFILMLELEITCEGKGTVPESNSYEWLTPVTLVFTPEVGNKVKEVQIDGKPVGTIDNYFFPELTKDHSVHVIFEPIIYSIRSTIHGEGVIEGSKDLNNIEYGEDCVITITPDEGWQLAIVFVNGEITNVVNNQITIKNVEENIGIVAYFTEIPVQSIPMWLLFLLAIIILILIILLIIASVVSGKRKRKLSRLKH